MLNKNNIASIIIVSQFYLNYFIQFAFVNLFFYKKFRRENRNVCQDVAASECYFKINNSYDKKLNWNLHVTRFGNAKFGINSFSLRLNGKHLHLNDK